MSVNELRCAATLALVLLAGGCVKQTTTAGDATPPDAVGGDTPIIPAEPANHATGDEIDATIPIVGGDTIELSSLRGRPVLLEISASWEPGFAEAHTHYVELLAEHPDLAIVLVIADPADAGLDGLSEQFTLAWDPAGALAAKFSVATLPTMFVIDRGGHVGAVVNGWSDEVQAKLSEAVASAAASG